jgi:acyl transferase domain-containing protein/D-arabinose 1-dehydrogenase-like Zn-dependent alcohol dehydrogenase/lauroyl/myristoyl acyltransferase/acyl carrier protein
MNHRAGVAVIGMSCRLPGAGSPEQFWTLLRDGRDAITEMPADRLAMLGLSGPEDVPPELRRGGFLDQVDRFDAAFFGISPREAAAMDPQQRLALELSWEALEDAGIAADTLGSSHTGIYVGAIATDYAELASGSESDGVARQAFTGTQRSIIANRVSYALGLRGPSMTVDTGQSSSLVAVHLACQSLLSGESTLALAGGVHLNIALRRALELTELGALSPDGRCFTFDARANGFVRGEGGALVVLKPLERAIADGDDIYCVIRGSAVNNDGGGDGLTAPDQAAQEEMLTAAYDNAGIAPGDVEYIELHGTGTPLGDKVEAGALGNVLGATRDPARPIAVGSAKTNVGHLEAAAGIVGLLKTALSLEHGELAPSLNFEQPNPEIPFADLGLTVLTAATAWPQTPRAVAGVSSFGIGGTNCHVVLERPPRDAPADDPPAPGLVPWVLGARSPGALRDAAERLAERAQAQPEPGIGDVGHSLVTTRASFGHRAVVIGERPEELLDGLRSLATDQPSPRVIEGIADPDLDAGRPVFVFPGQGGQWTGMAVDLLDRSAVFAAYMRDCEAALADHVDFSLEAVLRGDPAQPSLEGTEVVQPVLFSIMVSLAALWRSFGVHPAAVIGHSQGEIAAAHAAGALSLQDAARIVALRSRALVEISGRGGMMSVALTHDRLAELAGPLGDRVGVAALNGPVDLVVSGEPDALQALLASCEGEGVRAKILPVDYASHSAQIEPLRTDLLQQLGRIRPGTTEVPLYSTTTGERIDTAEMDAGYWYRNLRQTVQFATAAELALRDGRRTFIEISPHPVLGVPIESVAERVLGEPDRVAAFATLRRDQGGPERFLSSLAELGVRGGDVDWDAWFAGSRARRIRLPTYAFQRERYWVEGAPKPAVAVSAGPRDAAPEPESAPEPAAESSFATRLAALPEQERGQATLEVVRSQAAVVLGHATAADVNARLTFKELGFDSPATVELRNRVNRTTGLRLATTVLYDHPTPAGLAERVLAEITGTSDEAPAATGPVGADEPLAIVGMACRYPGGVRSAEDLWDLVASGGDAIDAFPTDRGWDVERLFDPEGERRGTSYVNRGGFLYDAGEFDAEHFGISPREALAMDPQQRLLLECSWEALEDAGIDPLSLHGSDTGVFTGLMSQDYGPPLHQPDEKSDGYALTGTETSVASGRVAYVLGLEGPSVSIDTACSSSLVAMHLACQALRAGECSMALAGGATVMASPGIFVEFSRQRGLSPDGRCRAFGASANGTGWGEGAGLLVLERLSVARERGHKVLAVVRGSAINQDGASNGLTAPSGRSQERVIRAALASAGLQAGDVDAVEAHGTGTTLGDPIEAQALIEAYGRERAGTPLRLGSLKSNVGHTQAAAGVGGVIKMVQALRHGVLPATLWAEEPSPHVEWADSGVELLTESAPWSAGDRVRRAGVSSFGISGTNAHVVLEEAPAVGGAEASPSPIPSRVLPFLLSGSSESGLHGQAGRLRAFVQAQPEPDAASVASALALRRAQLPHRAVALVSGPAELADCLGAFERGEFVDGLIQGVARRDVRVGFVFPGQGGQWPGMALALRDASPVFAASMQECATALRAYVDWSLEDVLRAAPGAPTLERVDVVQPALFAVMVSLAELWRAFGVSPGAVVGHSQGEIAAAYVAGALSLDDAARIVTVRSRLMGDSLSGRGGMVSVAASGARVTSYLERFGDRLSIAAVNGPSAVVVSGEPEALEELLAVCEADDVRARLLPVDYAAHSAQIETAREHLLAELASVAPRPGHVPLYSTVSGGRIDTTTMDADYWYRNLRETVRFEAAVLAMAQDGFDALIESSPHPVLTAPALETVDEITAIGSLRRDDGGLERFITSLAEAHVTGVAVDWTGLFGGESSPQLPLPTYAFQHRRYWLDRGDGDGYGGGTGAEHPLLDTALSVAGGQGTVFTGRLSLERHPWLADHVVMGTVLVPATAFVELALHAGARTGAGLIEELTIGTPLPLEDGRASTVQVTVSDADPDGTRRIRIYSRLDTDDGSAEWTEHASGTLAPAPAVAAKFDVPQPDEYGDVVDVGQAYERLAAAGYEYGPAFKGLRQLADDDEERIAELGLDDDQAATAESYQLHPVLADAALQAAVLARLESQTAGRPEVPVSFVGVRLHRAGAGSVRARLTAHGSVEVVDADGEAVLSIESVLMRAIDPSTLGASGPLGRDLYEVQWAELPGPPAGAAGGGHARVAVLGDGPVAEALGTQADRYGDIDALAQALAGGAPAPEHVVLGGPLTPAGGGTLADAVHDVTERALAVLKAWLAFEQLPDARLVLVTRRGVAIGAFDSPDLAQTAIPGLVRSAETENPDRIALLDLDAGELSPEAVSAAVSNAEREIAIRQDVLYVPRLTRVPAGAPALRAPDAAPWHVSIDSPGTLENIAVTPHPQAGAPLGPGQVRVAVHAAGLNFKDVVKAIGLVPPDGTGIGLEGAGVVLEVADDVISVAPGDRVLGLIPDAFGPLAVTDSRLLARMPEGWSFAEAASVPAVFLTAYYALVDVGRLERGDTVLIHGAAGGVGMAALQIAAHVGAEVFATAHPRKWSTVTALGVDGEHLGSSRDLTFRDTFLAATDGRGVDVVLDSLSGEFVDASLDLLPRGGRFVEIGKTDIRDAGAVAAAHPGVRYHAFDILQTSTERLGEMLGEIVALFERGVLHHLPISTWDVRAAVDAFRFMRESRHTGKIVLRIPQPPDLDGTVLITGGTGGLGSMLATHLAERHGVRRLLLTSRRGPQAPGAGELVAVLSELGCEAEVVACDVSDRSAVERLLAAVPSERPLTAVFHTAGVLDDGVIASLDGERLRRVMAPKLDAAIHLDELTRELELSEFVLFSSAAGTLGTPGQGNYASANTFLDALARDRRASGLPAMSLAFGLWERGTGMTSHLSEDGEMRAGPLDMVPMPDELGMGLIETARALDQPLLVPMRLNLGAVQARAAAGLLPSVLSGLVRSRPQSSTAPAGSTAAGSSLAAMVVSASGPDRERILTDFVHTHTAAALGYASADSIQADRPFKELGIDSLSAVELRNRLAKASGVSLPASLVFDHPTPAAVAHLLGTLVEGREQEVKVRPRARPRVDEPLAIVGMACRYPGGVRSPEDLWELVASGGDAIGELPTDRGWDLERLFDPDGDRPGTSYVRHGGFLYDAADFDAEHFGISPREALAMDPQQRLLLECSWEALEDAGIDPLSLRGSDTGVFAGVFDSDYASGDIPPELEVFRLTGGTTSVISGRTAYVLGLEGPAVSVDTACSSSLVALHLASQALRSGECDLALAGGVTVLVTPELFVDFSRQRGLSPDGRCRAFGAGANGTGFSDGVGVLVLERLSVARERGHRVLAVVRGSAINQDGASNGLTAPNGPSQERVINQALVNAGLEPSDVDAVEAHGTGTTLGDPIEAQALIATYGRLRADTGTPLWLGSLKSNIGHTQAAAGVAGVIKMVQALRHGVLPATLWAEEPSPHVDWTDSGIALLTGSAPWSAGDRVRRAGVSAFGISGTNAHVLIEEAPAEAAAPAADARSRVLPFLVSGSSDAGLVGQAARLRDFVAGQAELDPASVASGLAVGRAQLPHRAVAVVSGLSELADCLGGFERGEFVDGLVHGVARRNARVGFVFPGQGGQWPGMAVGLWETSPVFATGMEECATALGRYVDWSLEDVLRGLPGAPTLERVDVVQPALFAVMVSLAALWRSFGVAPSAVAGHSQGEIAAAYVAGALSLDDAARVVAVRSQLMRDSLSGRGGMVSVAAPAERVNGYLERFGGRVSTAAINGPSAVVVSGELDALEELLRLCEADDVRARLLPVDYAAHSAQIEQARERLLAELASVTPRAGDVPLYSTVTGERIDTATMDAEYWYRNLRETVRFEDAVRTMAQDGIGALIECSPHPVLTAAAQETVEAAGHELAGVGSLRRDDGGIERMITSLAEAHVAGIAVDWSGLFGAPPASAVPLPTYAFQRRRYWLAPGGRARDASALGQSAAEHPLLDAVVTVAGGEGTVFTGLLSLERHPWLADHVVLGQVLLPGTAFLECALHAAAHVGANLVEELVLSAPLRLEAEDAVAIQVVVAEPDPDGRRRVAIYSRHDPSDGTGEWTEHAAGVLAAIGEPSVDFDISWPTANGDSLDVELAYERLAAAGYDYGPAFQGLRHVTKSGDELLVGLALDEERAAKADAYHLHPVLLDSALQASMLGRLEARKADRQEVAFSFAGVRLHRGGASSVRAWLSADGAVRVVDERGAPVLSIETVQTRAVDPTTLATAGQRDLYEVQWVQIPTPSHDAASLRVAVLGEGPLVESLGTDVTRYQDLEALDAAVAAGAPDPDRVVVAPIAAAVDGPLAEVVHDVTERGLELLKSWVASEHTPDAKLVLVTDNALAVGREDTPDLTQAALPGLLRTAWTEHPDRFALLDVDTGDVPRAVLAAALVSEEPELVVRQGVLLAPRLTRARAAVPAPQASNDGRWHVSEGTILITGGTGGLGALVATHLAAHHGARHLLLVSRRGAEAPGAAELMAALAERGCEVDVAACDVGDRAAVERLLAEIPQERPLAGVFHAAGVLDIGLIASLDGERLRRVFSPKLDAAIHLHEMTRNVKLSEFVLFSSVAGTAGTPGQGNYAAANAFLDALAQLRHAEGLPGKSLAFGIWERETGMKSRLTEAGEIRSGPVDMLPMPDELGLGLIDAARAVDEPRLVPARLNLRALQERAAAGLLPSILSGLVRVRSQSPAAGGSSLESIVSTASEADREQLVIEFVRTHTAAALGYPSPENVEADRPFKELGIDSVSAVELRTRLAKASGLSLPASLVFDHPTPASVAELLHEKVNGRNGSAGTRTPTRPAESRPDSREDSTAQLSLRDAVLRTRQAVKRAGVVAHGSTWPRRLVPSSVAVAGINLYAAEARRRAAPPWRELVAFHEELLWYTPLRGAEVDVAQRAISEYFSCLEMFWRPWLMSSGELSGIERLRRARADGRGVVLAFPHFGPFHALGPISARYELGVSTIASPHLFADDGSGYDARIARRGRAYLELLGEGRSIPRAVESVDQSAFALAQSRLRGGELVAVAFDIVGTLPTPFLGRTIRLTNGPVRLARSAGAMIVPAVLRRRGMVPVLELGEPIDPERFADEATLQAALARQMEVWALELPEAVWPQQSQPGGAPLINGPELGAKAQHGSTIA